MTDNKNLTKQRKISSKKEIEGERDKEKRRGNAWEREKVIIKIITS